jgi:hypothetical protein
MFSIYLKSTNSVLQYNAYKYFHTCSTNLPIVIGRVFLELHLGLTDLMPSLWQTPIHAFAPDCHHTGLPLHQGLVVLQDST